MTSKLHCMLMAVWCVCYAACSAAPASLQISENKQTKAGCEASPERTAYIMGGMPLPGDRGETPALDHIRSLLDHYRSVTIVDKRSPLDTELGVHLSAAIVAQNKHAQAHAGDQKSELHLRWHTLAHSMGKLRNADLFFTAPDAGWVLELTDSVEASTESIPDLRKTIKLLLGIGSRAFVSTDFLPAVGRLMELSGEDNRYEVAHHFRMRKGIFKVVIPKVNAVDKPIVVSSREFSSRLSRSADQDLRGFLSIAGVEENHFYKESYAIYGEDQIHFLGVRLHDAPPLPDARVQYDQ